MADTYAQQLVAAKTKLDAILATPIVEYQTIEGSGGQKIRHAEEKQLRDTIDWLEMKIATGAGATRPRRILAILHR